MILDTNGLSALADGDLALEPILRRTHDLAVPTIVLGGYLYGISQSRQRAKYEQWLMESIPSYRVLDVNLETAERYAEILQELKKAGHPIPANDLWIAALVRQHDLPLISRDQHFDFVAGLTRIAW